jgi:hypothetical protein
MLKSRSERMFETIKKIESNQQRIIDTIFYLFSFILTFIYFSSYEMNEVVLKKDDISRRLITLKKNILILNDSGIIFYGLYIPYEYIITFGNAGSKVYIQLFGDFEPTDKEIKLYLGNNRVNINFQTNNKFLANSLTKKIQNNMFYHLKYHNIIPKVVEWHV